MFADFRNEPLTDWSRKENREKMRQALLKVRRKLWQRYPFVVGSTSVLSYQIINSLNPANFKETVGLVSMANNYWVDKACNETWEVWQFWQKVPYQKRAEYLFKAAQIMRDKRFELVAWAVLEIGKNWQEADADVAEAIDFLEYYGNLMLELGEPQITEEIPGELNETYYVPRGVVLVIGVWNFPFAINVGMISAALVTGNTVVFKPASTSAVIGYKIYEIFKEAGLPDGVMNFVPGTGGEVGEALAKHPKVIGIAVTGSKETGLRLQEIVGKYPCEYGFKEIIAGEFGGKGRIILDRDADLVEATKAVRDSWLGFQGQKCSACSVLIPVEDVYDAIVEKLIDAAKSLKIGPPEDPSNFMGPVIDEKALKKIKDYVEIGKIEGKLAYIGELPQSLAERGYYHPPVIFTDVKRKARIAQEEIFGPILTVVKARDFDEAIEIFNDSEYALTGGLFSRLPSHIERAKRELNVGNLYINRKITGALVRRQPFGGWKFSGVGSKAGGPDYLKRFMYSKTISVNTMRKGFASFVDADIE